MTIKYVGNGSYFAGIPARDLSDEEFAALPENHQQALLSSGLYAPETEAPLPTKTKKAAAPAPVEAPTGG